jgi:capsule polysaccharide export protein KpsE/RkpR
MILQAARDRWVVAESLLDTVPQEKQKKRFPSESAVESIRGDIVVLAPKGSEFGESDLLYLQVKAGSRDESITLNRAVARNLAEFMNELRNKRSRSVIEELSQKLKLTQRNLDQATSKLEAMERQIGSDLGELRTLSQSGSGESNLRTALSNIKNDLRNARAQQTTLREQLEFLHEAGKDPDKLVATSNRLLENQAGLKRLKDGLVDAQLRVSELLGKMNRAHPSVKAAMVAEQEIRHQLHVELEAAIRGTHADIQVTEALIASHEQQMAKVQERMNELAAMRARYENLVVAVQDRAAQVKESQRALAEARASQGAAATSSLLTLVGEPDPGTGPAGPGRFTVFLAAWFGGLLIGVGCFFLLTQPVSPTEGTQGRRWSDQVVSAGRMLGRRASDHTESGPEATGTGRGRRATDRTIPTPDNPAPGRRATDGAAAFPSLELPSPADQSLTEIS